MAESKSVARRLRHKLHAPDRVRIRVYPIVDDRVELAVEYGWNRAHKHTATPGENEIRERIHQEVMAAFCELFDFDPESVS